MIVHFKDSQLFYETYGEGHPILILHAMGTDHRSMTAWIEPIFHNMKGFQRIYIDIPAHGKSKIGKSLKSTQDFLDMILSFIETELKVHTFSLVGHSYGGYLAQGIFSRKRDSVKSLCLLAPAIHKKERTLPIKVVREVDEDVLKTIDPEVRGAINTLLVYQTKENIESFLRTIQPGRLLADREFLLSNWREEGYYLKNDTFSDMNNLHTPTLFILGKQDSICGYRDYLPFLDMFSNLSFSVLDQAGHLMTIEKRAVVQSLFKDWLLSSKLKKEISE
ncbi:alpha/beta fold hydrolase [Metabacillus litoralis]|uniref:alpha/beta fold hydrolase n=1 Tax=Metabacillus litoralis TaxID=152268 RepID=UPI0020408547|nr:alpha/beta hydrolase [Metabacillus litoralis]MCM3163324.1 alpha/beta hydrolase [Metabacillus litoralis]